MCARSARRCCAAHQHGLARADEPLLLRRLNHRERDAVLDRGARLHDLQLGGDARVAARPGDAVQEHLGVRGRACSTRRWLSEAGGSPWCCSQAMARHTCHERGCAGVCQPARMHLQRLHHCAHHGRSADKLRGIPGYVQLSRCIRDRLYPMLRPTDARGCRC